MRDEEEHVEAAEEDRLDREEIASDDGCLKGAINRVASQAAGS
jgi:hypothetical protein